MNCKKVSGLLTDYVDGYLSDSICEEVEEHIEICEICAEDLRATQSVVFALGQLSNQKSPVDCWVGVKKLITEKPNAMPFWQRWLMTPAVAVPAMAALIMMMFFVWPSPVHETDLSQIPNSQYKHFISAHSRLQRLQAFSDHDATFVAAELENASYEPVVNRQ